jgi:hypothetical protein
MCIHSWPLTGTNSARTRIVCYLLFVVVICYLLLLVVVVVVVVVCCLLFVVCCCCIAVGCCWSNGMFCMCSKSQLEEASSRHVVSFQVHVRVGY